MTGANEYGFGQSTGPPTYYPLGPASQPPLSARPAQTQFPSRNGSSHTSPTSPSNGGRAPPPPPRKPDTLRKKDLNQVRQIQSSGDDIRFTENDIIIAVMGVTGAGKSTFISLLSAQEIEIGHGLQSCTSKVGVYHFMHQGRRIFLIDTPGFDDTNRSDAEVLKDVAFWLAAAYQKKTTLAGILYLHRISDQKMQGSALRNLRMFQQLCGSNNLSSVVLATTHWTNLLTGDAIPEAQGREREDELMTTHKFWGAMIQRGSRVVRHDGTQTSALNIVSSIIGRRQRVVLDIQKQLIDQHRNLDDTTAAQALQSELLEERRKGQERLAELKEEMKIAMEENDLKWQKQNEADQAEARAAIEKTHAETAALRTNLAKIAKEKDEQFRKMQEDMAAQANKFQDEIRKSNEALKAAQEESQRRAEAHERQRREDAERARQQAEEHQRESAEREERIRQESNAAIAEQMLRDREDAENRYQQQRRDAEEAAAKEQARWERQMEADRERTQMLIDEREETKRRLWEVQREQNKSKAPGFLRDAIKVFANVFSIGTAILGGPWLGIWA